MIKRFLSPALGANTANDDLGNRLTQSEAHHAVLDEWREWPHKGDTPSEYEMYEFYSWLRKNRSYAVEFGRPDCKWRFVRTWLLKTENRQ